MSLPQQSFTRCRFTFFTPATDDTDDSDDAWRCTPCPGALAPIWEPRTGAWAPSALLFGPVLAPTAACGAPAPDMAWAGARFGSADRLEKSLAPFLSIQTHPRTKNQTKTDQKPNCRRNEPNRKCGLMTLSGAVASQTNLGRLKRDRPHPWFEPFQSSISKI